MKPPLSDIKNRAQFQKILTRTLEEMSERAKAQPVYPLWQNLLAQLRAMEDWTKDKRVPTKEERDRISMGTLAMREIEPTDDLELYDLSQRLHELQYYFQEQL